MLKELLFPNGRALIDYSAWSSQPKYHKHINKENGIHMQHSYFVSSFPATLLSLPPFVCSFPPLCLSLSMSPRLPHKHTCNTYMICNLRFCHNHKWRKTNHQFEKGHMRRWQEVLRKRTQGEPERMGVILFYFNLKCRLTSNICGPCGLYGWKKCF